MHREKPCTKLRNDLTSLRLTLITSKVFDPTLYKTEPFVDGNFQFLYRYIDTETMEGIIKAKTTNFVAVGKNFYVAWTAWGPSIKDVGIF